MALLEILIPEIPVAWSRARGSRNRFKNERLEAWQELVKDIARQEIEMSIHWDMFPCASPLYVQILVLFDDLPSFQRFSRNDGDNVEKGIYDALSGVVWADDKIKNIPIHSFAAALSPTSGTFVSVQRLGASSLEFLELSSLRHQLGPLPDAIGTAEVPTQ